MFPEVVIVASFGGSQQGDVMSCQSPADFRFVFPPQEGPLVRRLLERQTFSIQQKIQYVQVLQACDGRAGDHTS